MNITPSLIKYHTEGESALILVYKIGVDKPYQFEKETHEEDKTKGELISSEMNMSDAVGLFDQLDESISFLDNSSDDSVVVPSRFARTVNGKKHFIKAKSLKEYRSYVKSFRDGYEVWLSSIETAIRITNKTTKRAERERFLADQKTD